MPAENQRCAGPGKAICVWIRRSCGGWLPAYANTVDKYIHIMYICINIYIYMYRCIDVYIHIRIYVYICMYVCMNE